MPMRSLGSTRAKAKKLWAESQLGRAGAATRRASVMTSSAWTRWIPSECKRTASASRDRRWLRIAGHYALGLEPSTALRENQAGPVWFPMLEPGESRRLGVTIELLEGAAGANLLDQEVS